jgi:hypothetical protein
MSLRRDKRAARRLGTHLRWGGVQAAALQARRAIAKDRWCLKGRDGTYVPPSGSAAWRTDAVAHGELTRFQYQMA